MGFWKQLKGDFTNYYDNMCMPVFSESEKDNNIAARKRSAYVRYCKLAASVGICSDKQISAMEYFNLLESGFVESETSYGKHKGEWCLYNRKSDKTLYIKDLEKKV
jgi:hypothetical protein